MQRIIGVIVLISSVALAQPAPQPVFEVAVVRRALPLPGSAAGFRSTGGPGTDDPIRYVCRGSMWSILQAAFGVKPDRFEQLPDWTRERRFEIEARVPAGPTTAGLQ